MVQCGIFAWCIVGFERWVYSVRQPNVAVGAINSESDYTSISAELEFETVGVYQKLRFCVDFMFLNAK